MLPTNLSTQTVLNSLYLQQLEEEVIASNLSNPSLDSNGYLMNSLEAVNSAPAASYMLDTPNGNFAIGSGPEVQSITRLRDFFLDQQIQTESSVVGYNSVINQYLDQINAVINPNPTTGVGTLNYALTQFANAWATLAGDPLSEADRAAVTQTGSAFATLANNQFDQLQNYQQQLNGQVTQTVNQINGLQQLSSINQNILKSSSANDNPLLDARDYALDQLSQLVQIQTNIGVDGTVSVYLGGSSLDLVDPAGASILQVNSTDPYNPSLSDITLQSSEGSQMGDVTAKITGGQLGGELYARDVVVQSYMTQVDQIATSVMNVTNLLTSAGYAADGATTGVNFFTGTGAQDINVNASILDDPQHNLIEAAINPNDTADGTIAQFLGNLPNLLANNYIESFPGVGGGISPSASLSSQAGNFITTPVSGSFTVNGNTVNYNVGESIDDILNSINTVDPNVDAVFNQTTQQFYILSPDPITIANLTGNFVQWAAINNVLTSTIRIANGFEPGSANASTVIYAGANSALDSIEDPLLGFPNNVGNSQAFRVTPSTSGSFAIDGFVVPFTVNGVPGTTWYDTMSMAQIVAGIKNASAAGVFKGTSIVPIPQFSLNPNVQTLTLLSGSNSATTNPLPITINDITGNFTVFTGLDGNTSLANMASGILTNISSDVTNQDQVLSQAQASLTQLNTAQANIGAVSMPSSSSSSSGTGTTGTTLATPGVPLASIEQEAIQAMTAYNASLDVLNIIDQMYSDLIGVVGGSAVSTNTFSSGSTSLTT
jgi:flagellar hook-associated protein 1